MPRREIVTIGHPALRKRAREVEPDELRSPEIQGLIDDLIETKRAAHGAGLAANQVGVPVRVAIAEVDGANPRYPYKPPIPLTVMVNPTLEPAGDEVIEINEGCLSVPDLRGSLVRLAAVRVRYLDRADPRSLSTWEHFERSEAERFAQHAREIVARYGQ